MLWMGDAYLACRERIPQTLTLKMVQALEEFLPHIQVVAQQLAEELEEKDLIWPAIGLARAVTFSEGVTPWLPLRRLELMVAPGSVQSPLVAC